MIKLREVIDTEQKNDELCLRILLAFANFYFADFKIQQLFANFYSAFYPTIESFAIFSFSFLSI